MRQDLPSEDVLGVVVSQRDLGSTTNWDTLGRAIIRLNQIRYYSTIVSLYS